MRFAQWLAVNGLRLVDKDWRDVDAWTLSLKVSKRPSGLEPIRYIPGNHGHEDLVDSLEDHGVARAAPQDIHDGFRSAIAHSVARTADAYAFDDVVAHLGRVASDPRVVMLHAKASTTPPQRWSQAGGWSNLAGTASPIEVAGDRADHDNAIALIEAIAAIDGLGMGEPMLMCIGDLCTLQDGIHAGSGMEPTSVLTRTCAHILAGLAVRVPEHSAHSILRLDLRPSGSACMRANQRQLLGAPLLSHLESTCADPALVEAVRERDWKERR